MIVLQRKRWPWQCSPSPRDYRSHLDRACPWLEWSQHIAKPKKQTRIDKGLKTKHKNIKTTPCVSEDTASTSHIMTNTTWRLSNEFKWLKHILEPYQTTHQKKTPRIHEKRTTPSKITNYPLQPTKNHWNQPRPLNRSTRLPPDVRSHRKSPARRARYWVDSWFASPPLLWNPRGAKMAMKPTSGPFSFVWWFLMLVVGGFFVVLWCLIFVCLLLFHACRFEWQISRFLSIMWHVLAVVDHQRKRKNMMHKLRGQNCQNRYNKRENFEADQPRSQPSELISAKAHFPEFPH